jgi:hypothetical protein
MRASYVGSAEHKDQPSWLGLPRLRRRNPSDPDDHRQNATVCPLVTEEDRNRATQWVRQAIGNGQFDPRIWAGEFPRNIWHCDTGTFWQGRLTQRGAGDCPNGEYKGWPISRVEWNETFG